MPGKRVEEAAERESAVAVQIPSTRTASACHGTESGPAWSQEESQGMEREVTL